MVHLDGEAAGAEVEATLAAPDNQGAEAADANDTSGEADFYEEGDPFEDGPEREDDQPALEDEEPIEAPVSLKADEKEKFSQLPSEAQQALTEIIQRRERDAQKGVTAAQAAQRQAEANAADQIAQTQAQHAEAMGRFLQAFAPQPPPIELAQHDPQAFVLQKAIFDDEYATFQQIAGAVVGMQDQAQQHFKAQEQAQNQERLRGLMSIPEFASEASRAEFINGIESVGTAMGYDVETLTQMDVRDMAALKRAREWKDKAEKWDAHQKKRNERPRVATGRFTAAPAGARSTAAPTQNDTLKMLYPND